MNQINNSSQDNPNNSYENIRTHLPKLSGLFFDDSPLMPALTELAQSFEERFKNLGSTTCQIVTDENEYQYTRLAFRGDNFLLDQFGYGSNRTFFSCINHFYPAPKEIQQNYHNHRAQFLSYIFSPDAEPNEPIYRLHVGRTPNRNEAVTVDLCSGDSYSMIDFSNLYHEVEALKPLYTVLLAELPSKDARETNVSKKLFSGKEGLREHARIHNIVVDHFQLNVRRFSTEID